MRIYSIIQPLLFLAYKENILLSMRFTKIPMQVQRQHAFTKLIVGFNSLQERIAGGDFHVSKTNNFCLEHEANMLYILMRCKGISSCYRKSSKYG